MVSPVRGRKVKEAVGGDEPVMPTAADFDFDAAAIGSAACPAGHRAVAAHREEDAPERVELVFSRMDCGPCALRTRCPVTYRRRPEAPRARGGVYVLNADLIRVNVERRRRAESGREWRKRYRLRAGIEGTNSEMKRGHGLGRLRVRGGGRVELAVYLNALACNVKRMVRARLTELEDAMLPQAAPASDPMAA